jgi:uroporphyrinogen decarboxylase
MQFKEDLMSPMERMEALFRYEKPDRVPINMITVGFVCKNMGRAVADGYGDPEAYFDAFSWTGEQYGWDSVPQNCPHTILGAPDFGGDVRLPTGEFEGAMVITSYPVQNEEDVEKLEPPDPATSDRLLKAKRLAEIQQDHGLPATFVSRSPLTVAANTCGLEKFLRWAVKKPELCRRLMTLALDHIFNVIADWAGAFGPENMIVFMSSPSESNQVISPKHFENVALPFHLEYHKRLASFGIKRFWFHICGDQNMNLPAFADNCPWPHPSILSFGHEVDLEDAANYFPEDIIYGNVEPAVIQMSTARQVYELTRNVIEKGKRIPGGFILSAGCELPPFAPSANVFAMTKAVNDFGWYA